MGSHCSLERGAGPLFTTDLRGPMAIGIGNEGTGSSDERHDAASRRVTIPMPGNFKSLCFAGGVSVRVRAAARRRQRQLLTFFTAAKCNDTVQPPPILPVQ